jgi:penicillin G amidase
LQLDVSTEYYRYYQNLALTALPPPGDEADEATGRLRRYLEAWDGEAGVNSLGLPLIVAFSEELQDEILSPIVARCREFDPGFQLGWTLLDDPVRRIIETGRPELIPAGPKDRTWRSFLRGVLDRSAAKLKRSAGVEAIDSLAWRQVNKVEMAHPLSQAIPLLGLLLDMPRTPLPGCVYCLRYTIQNMGAVSRMVVAAGHEADGVLQIPGGQSGQPTSPHYADQQASWLAGTPIPFLAGEERGRLTLLPSN